MAMQWPQSLDYYQAVQTPAQSFADGDLMSAEVAVNELGLPQACAGNFADVYQFRSGDGRRSWAVKCFTRPAQRLAERYREISRHLQHCKLPLKVRFQYLERGIKLRGQWYPVLKMDWVEGQTLRQFVQEHLDSPKILGRLFDLWLKVEPWLVEAQVVHGDLQHGNILLVPGQQEGQVSMRLVDYDGMWVPGLSGQPTGEFGHPAYQHPQRLKEKVYTPAIDRFPNLVIGCALRCLTWPERADWWSRFDNGDNLLFTQADFESPEKSQLLHELWESGNEELQAWAGHVAIASRTSLDGAPLLGQLSSAGEAISLDAEAQDEARRLLGYRPRDHSLWAPIEPDFHAIDLARELPPESVATVNAPPDVRPGTPAEATAHELEPPEQNSVHASSAEAKVTDGRVSQRLAVGSGSLAEDPKLEWLAEAVQSEHFLPMSSSDNPKQPPPPPTTRRRGWRFGIVHLYGTLAFVLAMTVIVGIGIALFGPGSQTPGDAAAIDPDAIVMNGDEVDQRREDASALIEAVQFKSKKPPPFAVAPFDQQRARDHQEAWANHLGVPVEWTNSIGMKFHFVPPGEFRRGSPQSEINQFLNPPRSDNQEAKMSDWHLGIIAAEGPQRSVRLTVPFYLATFEVTQSQFVQVMARNTSHFTSTRLAALGVKGAVPERHPVDSVTWFDAIDFCSRLSGDAGFQSCYGRDGESIAIRGGNGYRLPTAAEWEFACRAGTETQWSAGDSETQLNMVAWHCLNSGGRTHTVGELQPNAFGFFDMHGNVWEWCQDAWRATENQESNGTLIIDPQGPQSGELEKTRIFRGGDWINPSVWHRSGCRYPFEARSTLHNVGFRVALSVDAVRQVLSRPLPPNETTWFGDDHVTWRVLDPLEYKSDAGSSIMKLPDKSLLVAAPPGPAESYTIKADTDLKRITGLRLEAMEHDSLHLGGPGRSYWLPGGYQLEQVNVQFSPVGSTEMLTPVSIRDACADFSQPGCSIRNLVDGEKRIRIGTWGTGESGEVDLLTTAHTAILEFVPYQPPAERTLIRIQINNAAQQALGRFRLSITGDPRPASPNLDPDGARRAAAQWVVDRGGAVDISLLDGIEQRIQGPAPLPAAPFQLRGIVFVDKVPRFETADVERLAKCPEIHRIVLRKCNDDALRVLKACPQLEALDLSHGSISETGLQALGVVPFLRSLWITHAGSISTKGLSVVEKLPRLEGLNLEGTRVAAEGLAHLSWCDRLHDLNLRNTGLADSELRRLRGARVSRAMNLSGPENVITGAGLKDFRGAWHLNISDCPIGDTALTALQDNSVVFDLHLSNTQITDQGLRDFARAKSLAVLVLRGTGITAAGVEGLRAMKGLQTLVLSATRIDDQAVPHLKKLTNLVYLELLQTNLTESAINDLRKSLPKCNIQYSPAPAAPRDFDRLRESSHDKTKAENDANTVRNFQEKTASELKRPVECTNSIGMKIRLIPAGKFRMGSPLTERDRSAKAETEVDVTLTKSFYLGATEVTQREWKAVVGTAPWTRTQCIRDGDNFPATCVSWEDAQEFCKQLSERENETYRLPTEAEWEYACRGGTTTRFSFGNDDSQLGEFGWFDKNTSEIGEQYAHEVALKQTNPFGLHDMHGNVWEWCEDIYTNMLPGGTDPLVSAGGVNRVGRGGLWRRVAANCRSAHRSWSPPNYWADCIGFRVARSMPDAQADEKETAPVPNKADRERKSEVGSPPPSTALVHRNRANSAATIGAPGPNDLRPYAGGLAFSPAGAHLVSVGLNQRAVVWDVLSGRSEYELAPHNDVVYSVAFSHDGKRIATAGADKTAKVWSLDVISDAVTMLGDCSNYGIQFSPDGTRIAVAGSDATVRLRDSDNGRKLMILRGVGDACLSVAYNSDGSRLAASCVQSQEPESTVIIWDASSGQEIARFNHRSGRAFAFSADGRLVATNGPNSQISIGNADTGAQVESFTGHNAEVTAMAFSPDGKHLASGSQDATLRIWDVATGRSTVQALDKGVVHVAYGPNGERVATSDVSGAVKLWNIDGDAKIRVTAGTPLGREKSKPKGAKTK